MSELAVPPVRRPARGIIRFLGSLTFLIIILTVMLIALILPTVVNYFNPDLGYDVTVGALRRDWYGGWWFNILMALLMVNLTVCTVIRTPWRYFWMWGFLITHSGILTLMIGAAITFNTKIYGDLQAVEGETYDYFTIEHENELAVSTSEHERDTFQIRMNPYSGSTARKSFRMKDAPVIVHVDEYVPNVGYDAVYKESPAGKMNVAEIRLHPEDEEPRRKFLVAGVDDDEIMPLMLLAMPMKASQFARLVAPTGEDGLLVLTIDGVTQEIDVAKNQGQPVKVGNAEVTVKEWGLPGKEIGDYWVRFEVRRPGTEVETWRGLAYDFDHPMHREGAPDSPNPNLSGTYTPRLKPALLHGANTRGVMYLCRLETEIKYVAIGSNGDKQSGPLRTGEKFRYPFMRLPLDIEFVRWMDRAEETVEALTPRKNRPRVPALRVTVASGKEQESHWVKHFMRPVQFTVGERVVDVAFRGRRFRELPFSVTLDDFRVKFNRGTMAARHFESDLTLTDLATGEITKQTIEVNTPMKYKGFVIYQASWNPDNHRMSIFQISKDPGKKVLYLGWVMAVSGSIFMFFLKPFLQSLIKAGSRASDAPLASAPSMAFFALVTLGTVLGMLAPLVLPGVDALWLGLGVAGADLILALVVVLVARAWRAIKPVRALQVGEIIAAGWCLNTAALVILLMMKVTA